MAERPVGSVRNMKAMFEAKAESSPPSRGRSPAGSEGFGARSDSSRPLSKVRTSFVSVDGRPPLSNRKDSDSRLNEGTEGTTTSEHRSRSRPDLAALGRTSSLHGVREEDVAVASVEGSPDSKRPQELEKSKSSGERAGLSDASNIQETAQAIGEKATGVKPKIESKTKSVKTSTVSGQSSGKHGTAPAQSTKAVRTPTTPKASAQSTTARRSPAKQPAAGNTSVNTSRSTTKTLPTRTTPVTKSTTTTRGTIANKTSTTVPKQVSSRASTASPGGFVKPPPREATRPVKLPAGATATTTASSAKTGRSSGIGIAGRSISKGSENEGTSNSRTSLPGQAKPAERFSRPTQSSTSKTQEKSSASSSRRTSGVASTRTSDQGATPTATKTKAPLSKPVVSKAIKTPSNTAATTTKPLAKQSHSPRAQGNRAAASRVANAKTQLAKPKDKLVPKGTPLLPKKSEPIAEPPLAPETQEAISPDIPAEPEIAGEIEQSPTAAVAISAPNPLTKDAIESGTPVDARDRQQEETIVLGSKDNPAAANEQANESTSAVTEEPQSPEPAVSASTQAEGTSTSAPGSVPGMREPVEVPSTSNEVENAPSFPTEAAAAPPASAIAEALSSPPPPMPSKPAPTGPEATAQAFELEVEANELAQVDSAAPAAAPELKERTTPLSSPASSRPNLVRKASEGFRLPEAATMPLPSKEEIEAVRRESIAAGEALENADIPVKIEGSLDESEEAVLVDMEEKVAAAESSTMSQGMGGLGGEQQKTPDLLEDLKDGTAKTKDEAETSLVDLD